MDLVPVKSLLGTIKFVNEEFCLKSSPKTLDSFSSLAKKDGRLLWMKLGETFVYRFNLRMSLPRQGGFKCFYYIHLHHRTDQSITSNLYVHAKTPQGALSCLEYILRMGDEGFDYVSISCLQTKTNFVFPNGLKQCNVSNFQRSSSLSSFTHSTSTGSSGTPPTSPLPLELIEKIIKIHPDRWLLLKNICLTNTQSHVLASLPAKLSLTGVQFQDGGATFVRSYTKTGRALRGVRFRDCPFDSEATFSTFMAACGKSNSLESIAILTPIKPRECLLLTGLAYALRQSSTIRSLCLGWSHEEKENLLLQSGAKYLSWLELVHAIAVNQSLRKFILKSTDSRIPDHSSKASRALLTREVAAILKRNPRIQHVPFNPNIFDSSLWDIEVVPILGGEYHSSLIRGLHEECADDDELRGALVGRIVSRMVAPNPLLVFQCLAQHLDLVVQYRH